MHNPASVVMSEQFTLEDLTFIPIGHHQPMHLRPYVMSVSQGAANSIAESLNSDRTGVVRPDMVSSIADEIISPSAIPFDSRINQEWVSSKRYAFILKVKTVNALKGVHITYIQGYTDYDGINIYGTADPRMNLIINSVIETTLDEYKTPMGVYRKERLLRRYNVMTTTFDEYSYTQRPTDVMDSATMVDLQNMLNGSSDWEMMYQDDGMGDHIPGMYPTSFDTYNANNTLNAYNANSISSNIENDVSSVFLTKTLTAGILGAKNREVSIGDSPIDTGSGMMGMLREPSISENQFIRYYTARFQGRGSGVTTLSYGNLVQLDRTIEDRFICIKLNKNVVDPVLGSTPEVGDHWQGQDIVTVKAYSIIEAAASIAMQNGFNKLYFSVSNKTNPRGETDFVITNWKSFIQLGDKDMMYLVEYFKREFENNVFIPETKGGVIPLHLDVYVDILGTSKIYIEYSSMPANWYTAPTIANSSYTPVLTLNKDNVDMLGYSFNALIGEVANLDFHQKRNVF